MSFVLRFLGTGSTGAYRLGSAAAVLERDGEPLLLIDCGLDIPDRFRDHYGAPPPAVFVTHDHLDHVSGFERLYAMLQFEFPAAPPTRVFVHPGVLTGLQQRVAGRRYASAEGGSNFWDPFRLITVTEGFWHDQLWFEVFATRHHAPGTSFGCALPGTMAFTGDTRPIPEVLAVYAGRGELVAHDCSVRGNPSHSGVDELAREYPEDLQRRLVLYHYGSAEDREILASRGFRVALPGQEIELPEHRSS